jgi:hypothetical protein
MATNTFELYRGILWRDNRISGNNCVINRFCTSRFEMGTNNTEMM